VEDHPQVVIRHLPNIILQGGHSASAERFDRAALHREAAAVAEVVALDLQVEGSR